MKMSKEAKAKAAATKEELNKKLYTIGNYEVWEDKYQYIVRRVKSNDTAYFTTHMGVISFLLKRFNLENCSTHNDALSFMTEREKLMDKFEDKICKKLSLV